MLGFTTNEIKQAKYLFGFFCVIALFVTSAQGVAYYLENVINDDEGRYLLSLFISGGFMYMWDKIETKWKNYNKSDF